MEVEVRAPAKQLPDPAFASGRPPVIGLHTPVIDPGPNPDPVNASNRGKTMSKPLIFPGSSAWTAAEFSGKSQGAYRLVPVRRTPKRASFNNDEDRVDVNAEVMTSGRL